jgi:Ca2+-binding RTX toxin-like protein
LFFHRALSVPGYFVSWISETIMAIATVAVGFPVGTNMDLFDVGLLATGTISAQTSTSYQVQVGGVDERLMFSGAGFTYTNGAITGGTVTGLEDQYMGAPNFTISSFAIAASSFVAWAGAQDNAAAKAAIFSGADVVTGGPLDDLLRSYGGADTLSGGAGADTLDGGAGEDVINGGAGRDVITTGGGGDTVVVGLGHSGVTEATADSITDWNSSDLLLFANVPASASEYVENTAPDFAIAATYASGLIVSGAANVVAVAYSGGVAVFADSANNNGAAEDVVILTGKTLADVSYENFTTTPVAPAPPTPAPPTPAPPTPAPPTPAPPAPSGGGGFGGGFGGGATAGTPVTGSEGADTFAPSAAADNINGAGGNDAIDGGDGNDTLGGGTGNDTLQGGAGDDIMDGGVGSNYLRGGDGHDQIVGGSGFDDINGNAGNDTESGGFGDDWVVGGKDNDQLAGDSGSDVVWGNLGDDTLDGGLDNDQVRGGQGNDVLTGGAGDDFVSGDRGNDTVSGGLGADLFHGSQDAGIDRVIDFNLAEGDRVMLDPGTTYTLAQVGADTVIDMGAGNQMILVGVQLSTLPQGWIF